MCPDFRAVVLGVLRPEFPTAGAMDYPRQAVLQRVAFTNFRGFRSFEAEFAAVTALLGPNSSGKTTALHAIRLACELLQVALASEARARLDGETIVVGDDELVREPSRLLPLVDWQALFVDQEVGEGTRFEIRLDFAQTDPITQVKVGVTCVRNQQLKLWAHIIAPTVAAEVSALPRRSHLVNRRLSEFVRTHAPMAILVPPFYGTVLNEEYRARAVINRLLGSGDQSHVVRNLIADLDPDRFVRLNSFLRETIGAELRYRTSSDRLQTESPLRVTFVDTNGEIELSAAGAGLINLVALYAALSRWSNDPGQRPLIFLLDEPEAHLHPRLQADSAARIAKLVTDEFAAQLVLATHSVDILNRLAREGARLLRCDRAATPSVTVLASDAELFNDLSGWVDLAPYTAINFLASRRVAFCEGRDELAILPKLAALRYRNDSGRLTAFRRWALIELQGSGNARVAELLSRLVDSDVVRAQAQEGAFRVLVVLDRDFERQPGFSDSQHRNVSHSTLVWSSHSLESLLLQPSVLAVWIRALLGDQTPADIDAYIQRATSEADADPTLCDAAKTALSTAMILRDQRGGVVLANDGGRAIQECISQAASLVSAAPSQWQRGKDRGRFILGKIRDALPPALKRSLPGDIILLVERADANRIGDPQSAIPGEVEQLLSRMSTQ